MSIAPDDDTPPADVDTPEEDNTEAIAAGISACELELAYYQMGSKFFNDNYILLGYHVTDPSQLVGELDDDVQSALNVLAIETAHRMARIMRDDIPTTRKAEPLD